MRILGLSAITGAMLLTGAQVAYSQAENGPKPPVAHAAMSAATTNAKAEINTGPSFPPKGGVGPNGMAIGSATSGAGAGKVTADSKLTLKNKGDYQKPPGPSNSAPH